MPRRSGQYMLALLLRLIASSQVNLHHQSHGRSMYWKSDRALSSTSYVY